MDDGPKAGQGGHFVMAVNVTAFEEVARFKERVDAAIAQIHACRRAPGVDRLYVSGERESLSRAAYEREGIPLNEVTLRDIRAVAMELHVDFSGYGWLI